MAFRAQVNEEFTNCHKNHSLGNARYEETKKRFNENEVEHNLIGERQDKLQE